MTHWSPYDMPAAEAHGGKTVCQVLEVRVLGIILGQRVVSPEVRKEDSKKILFVALRARIVNRSMGDSQTLNEVDFKKRHGDERSLDYVKRKLSYLQDSSEV